MKTTLYNITKEEAKTLLEHFGYDIALIGIVLYNSGKASSIERGIYKAKKLESFAKK